MNADLINSLFVTFGFLFVVNNCRVMWKSKQAYGVSLLSVSFFTSWGIWNVYFFHHLHQWYSFACAALIAAADITWICLIIYLRRQQREHRNN